jgi:hypothetical protein
MSRPCPPTSAIALASPGSMSRTHSRVKAATAGCRLSLRRYHGTAPRSREIVRAPSRT